MLVCVRHLILNLMAGNLFKLRPVRGLAHYFDVRGAFLVDG